MTIPPPDPALVARFRADVVEAAFWGDPRDGLGLVVSGGADSLALLLLAHAAYPDAIAVVSVNHGLRAEAAGECAFVADLCARLGVRHDTIDVAVKAAGQGVQAAARAARRRAFGGWCQRNRVPWMLTAHHADDQAETVLMRLARGSGVAGLSGIDRDSPLPLRLRDIPQGEDGIPTTLIRPLLGWYRSELAAIVAAAGLSPVEDPSNADPRYDRTRFRALLRGTDLLDAKRIAAAADHCRDADLALGWSALTLARIAVRAEADRATLDTAPLTPWNGEIMRRILLDIFGRLGIWPQPRGAQVMRLIGLLHAGRTATLGGIKATPRDGVWTFTRAPPRRSH